MKQLRKHWVIIMATLAFITVHAQSSSNAEEPALPFQLWETPRDVPGVTFVDSEGRQVYLSAFRGKALLLNVWATWCPPCRKEMPALDRLENTLGGSKFEVIALSVDSVGLRDVKPFFESLGLNSLKIYLDEEGSAMRDLRVIGLPTTLILDRNGREIGRKIGPAKWDSKAVLGFLRKLSEE